MMVLVIVGALFGSFVLSRILFWLTSRWHGGYTRIVAVHGVLIAICLARLVVELEFEGGSSQRPLLYASAQALWLIVDLFAHRGRLEPERGAA